MTAAERLERFRQAKAARETEHKMFAKAVGGLPDVRTDEEVMQDAVRLIASGEFRLPSIRLGLPRAPAIRVDALAHAAIPDAIRVAFPKPPATPMPGKGVLR